MLTRLAGQHLGQERQVGGGHVTQKFEGQVQISRRHPADETRVGRFSQGGGLLLDRLPNRSGDFQRDERAQQCHICGASLPCRTLSTAWIRSR